MLSLLVPLLIGPLGPLELFIILGFVSLLGFLPVFILIKVAKSRGRSAHYGWWCLLGWLGFIVGLAVILVQPNLKQESQD